MRITPVGQSAYFISVNRNKRSVAVNMKTPEGCAIIMQLAQRADILIENFMPGESSPRLYGRGERVGAPLEPSAEPLSVELC